MASDMASEPNSPGTAAVRSAEGAEGGVSRPTNARCPGCSMPSQHDGMLSAFHVTDPDKLAASSKQGCPMCAILFQGLTAWLEEMDPRGYCLLNHDTSTTGFHALEVSYISIGSKTLALFQTLAHAATSWGRSLSSLPIGYEIPPTTASPESLFWTKENLKVCDHTHEQCRALQSPALLPTRVLDVSDETVVKLFPSRGGEGHYICLSHCWGLGAQTLPRTTSSTIAQNERGIPWNQLSAKFQDAITFTRNLGIRYLWIDSLCIIQDDQTDWVMEGSKMSSIYANAYLVIAAAAGSTDPNPGMFSPVNPELNAIYLTIPITTPTTNDASTTAPLPLPTNVGSTPAPGIFARRALSHIPRNKGYHSHSSWQRNQAHIPKQVDLFRRGWIFQERYLSRRTVFFGPEELSWECVQMRACQCSGISVLSVSNGDSMRPTYRNSDEDEWNFNTKRYYNARELEKIAKAEEAEEAEEAEGATQVATRWLRCVEEYSNFELTFDKDVFPALSGFTKVFKRALNCGYVAGIWTDFVQLGLTWHVKYWEEPPAQWRAPSWSWAAVKSPVSHIMRNSPSNTTTTTTTTHMAEVVDIGSTLIGTDTTGEISKAHMVLKGWLISTKIRYADFHGDPKYRHMHVVKLDYLLDKSAKVYSDYDVSKEGPRHLSEATDVACFLVCQASDSGTFYLLLVKRIQDTTPGCPFPTFERFGFVELFVRQAHRGQAFEDYIVSSGTEVTIMAK